MSYWPTGFYVFVRRRSFRTTHCQIHIYWLDQQPHLSGIELWSELYVVSEKSAVIEFRPVCGGRGSGTRNNNNEDDVGTIQGGRTIDLYKL